MKLLLTLLILASCATTRKSGPDPAAPYQAAIERFYATFPGAMLIEVRYGALSDIGAIGICEVSNARVIIDIETNSGPDAIRPDELIFHELGHCALGLAHTMDEHSLMYGGAGSPPVNAQTLIEMRARHRATCRGEIPNLFELQQGEPAGSDRFNRHRSCEIYD